MNHAELQNDLTAHRKKFSLVFIFRGQLSWTDFYFFGKGTKNRSGINNTYGDFEYTRKELG